jgi:HD-GYP domain-containing protein (c-di-GMP phosphodiesterase class II)
MLGFESETADAVRTLDEHWDGGGQPRGLHGEEIPLLGRILCLAQTAEIFYRAGGPDAAYRVARRRRGGWFDPALVDALATVAADRAFWDSLDAIPIDAWEPEDHVIAADEARLDQIAAAFAGVVDAKSPWTYRHSDRVGLILVGLARATGVDLPLRDLRRAALLHDIGKLAISNRILDKPAELTSAEFAVVRRHPTITEQVLARVPGCRHIVGLAGAHHERLDGSGYPRGLTAAQLSSAMRLLALADVYEALTSPRPYRAALAVMRAEVPRRLDPHAFATLEGALAADAHTWAHNEDPAAAVAALLSRETR